MSRPARDLLESLRARGVQLRLVRGRVTLRGSDQVITASLLEGLRDKAGLIQGALEAEAGSIVQTDAQGPPRWSVAAWADFFGPEGLRRLPGEQVLLADLRSFWDSTGEVIFDAGLQDDIEHGVALGVLEAVGDGLHRITSAIVDAPARPGKLPWTAREAVAEFLARRGGHADFEDVEVFLGADVTRRGVEDLMALERVRLNSGRLTLVPDSPEATS